MPCPRKLGHLGWRDLESNYTLKTTALPTELPVAHSMRHMNKFYRKVSKYASVNWSSTEVDQNNTKLLKPDFSPIEMLWENLKKAANTENQAVLYKQWIISSTSVLMYAYNSLIIDPLCSDILIKHLVKWKPCSLWFKDHHLHVHPTRRHGTLSRLSAIRPAACFRRSNKIDLVDVVVYTW